MLPIEKGIELPPIKPGKRNKYPFRYMEIGDSFLVPCPKEQMNRIQQSLAQCWRKDRFPNKKFASRCVADGVRCWRVE
jgi:hypothetical protein